MNDDEKKELEWLIGVFGHSAGTETDEGKQQKAVNNYEKLVRLKLDSERTESDIEDKKAKMELERNKLEAEIVDKQTRNELDEAKSLRQNRVDTMKTVFGVVLQGAVIVGSIWQVARVTKFTETNYLDSKPLNYGVSLVRDGFRKFM